MSRSRLLSSPYPDVNKLDIVAPVNKGGTGATNTTDAATQLGSVPQNKIGAAGGVAKVLAGVTVDKNNYPAAFPKGPTLNGPDAFYVNGTHTLTISNYDSSTNYNVSVSSGSVSRSGATITFVAPASPGVVQLTVGTRVVNIQVKTTSPVAPTITSPTYDAQNQASSVTITASAFQLPSGTPNHQSSDWELATDLAFTSVVASSFNDTVNKTSWTVSSLNPNVSYFIRVRYKDASYGYSQWSSVGKFTTKASFAITTEEAKLVASDKAASDGAGYSVAIDSTGTRAVVGAWQADPSSIANAGAAYVFTRSGSTWTQEAKLVASDAAGGDSFGTSVAIDYSGIRIIVGADSSDPGGTTNAGAAYVFTRSGVTWAQEAKLTASDKAASDSFGHCVSVDSDATRAVIGAYTADNTYTDSGAAYVFIRTGTSWAQEAKFIASDKELNGHFGVSCDVNSDGSRAIIGAYDATSGGTSGAGAAYIYVRSGVSWTEEAKLYSSDKTASDKFGVSVTIDNTATRVAIGAYYCDYSGITDAGAVYVFLRTGTSWAQEAKLSATDKASGDQFGVSVSSDSSCTRIAIGANQTASGAITSCGSLYVFVRNGTSWTQETKLSASDKAASDSFGWSVGISNAGDRVVSGVINSDPGGTTNAGAAYIYS